jgi:hypothetical protein
MVSLLLEFFKAREVSGQGGQSHPIREAQYKHKTQWLGFRVCKEGRS